MVLALELGMKGSGGYLGGLHISGLVLEDCTGE